MCVCAYGDADVKLYNHKGEGEGLGDVVDRTMGSDWLPQQSDFKEGGVRMRFTAPFSDINSLFRMLRNLRCPHGSAAISHRQKICNVIEPIHRRELISYLNLFYNYFKIFSSSHR